MPETGDLKEPCGGHRQGCSAAIHWTTSRHAGVTLLLLMPSCWFTKPEVEELERKAHFCSSSLHRFPVWFSSLRVLFINVSVCGEGCNLSSLRNGCAFLYPNVLLQTNFPCSFLPH